MSSDVSHNSLAAAPLETPAAKRRVGLLLFVFGTFTALLFVFGVYFRQGAIEARIDLNHFGLLGRHIAQGDGFSLGYGPTLRRAPLYPAFVALMLRVFGHYGPNVPDMEAYRPILILQCLMVGLTCATVGAIGRKLFGQRVGIVAGVLCAITPQVLRYAGMTEVETSMGLLIALMTLTGLNLTRAHTWANAVYFGLACGTTTLAKPIALLYPFLFSALLWWRSRRPGTSPTSSLSVAGRLSAEAALLPAIGIALAAFLVCLLPWTIRNMIVTNGAFKSISSNGPGEFLRGYVNAQPKFALLKQDFGGSSQDNGHLQWDWEANEVEDALLQQHGLSMFSVTRFAADGEKQPMEPRIDYELQKEKIEGAEAKRRLLHEPLGFVRKFVMQVFMFWYIVETRKKSLLVGGIAFVALALALFGWIQARRNRVDTFPIVSVVLYFNLLYAAILAFARYSMPVFPTLLILSAYGLTQLLPSRSAAAALSTPALNK